MDEKKLGTVVPTPHPDLLLGPHHCRTSVTYALELIEKSLSAEAAKHGGHLSADEIHRVIKNVKDTPHGLWVFYRNSSQLDMSNEETSSTQKHLRQDYFFRLIIGTFEHRFSDCQSADNIQPLLSRSIIWPFETALKVILGENFMAKSRETCSQIIGNLFNQLGDEFTWRIFYEDEQSMLILIRTCVMIVDSFRDFEVRKKWFLQVIENNIDKEDQLINDGVIEFSEADFKIIFTCLLAEYHRCVEKMRKNEKLASFLDPHKVAAMEQFEKKLESLEGRG